MHWLEWLLHAFSSEDPNNRVEAGHEDCRWSVKGGGNLDRSARLLSVRQWHFDSDRLSRANRRAES